MKNVPWYILHSLYSTPEELAIATEIFVLSVKLVSIDKLLNE